MSQKVESPVLRRALRARGFTLVELLAVVTIMGVLSTIAVYSMRKYIQAAKTSEAAEIIGSIKAGQEAYFDETFRYLQVSDDNGTEKFYPAGTEVSGKIKVQWGEASPTSCTNCGTRYRALGVLPAAAVLFRYSCVTGVATDNPNSALAPQVGSPSPFASVSAGGQPFYVVNAVSDLDGDGDLMTAVVGTNLMGDLYSKNVGE